MIVLYRFAKIVHRKQEIFCEAMKISVIYGRISPQIFLLIQITEEKT